MSEQVEMVNKCMSFIPEKMNKNEGRNLMTLLYKTGFLSDYLNALDAADENGLDDYGDMVQFSNYFLFDYAITINSKTGRITSLELPRMDWTDNAETYKTIELPPMIEQFDMLEKLSLYNCRTIPIEQLGKLPLLKNIVFMECHTHLLENIPEGLQLPPCTKMVQINISDSDSYSSLSPLMKVLPDTLEGIFFRRTTRKQTDEILRILEKDNLIFSQSLTTLGMQRGELNEVDLELLLFEVRTNFPNLHTLDVEDNEIESLLGIEARIKRVSSSSPSSSSSPQTKLPYNNNLCKLRLHDNPVCRNVVMKKTTSIDPKEKAAVLTLLNTFDRISNLGLHAFCYGNELYDPDIEYLLRRNKVNMNFNTTTEKENNSGGNNNRAIINRSLWPLIFERAYRKSHEIYKFARISKQEEKDRKNCATGLFELVRHSPFFAKGYPRQCHDVSNQNSVTTTNNNTTLKRKRSTHSS